MKGKNRKKIILSLRWAVIIVISCLIVFGKGRITNLDLGHAFILVYIFSNLALIFLPPRWFSNPKFFYSLVVFDTGLIALGMYLSEKVTTDFYLVFFFIIILASLSRNYKLLMIISAITASLYGMLLLLWGLFGSENAASYILRIPFVFIMAAFYGYIVQTFTKGKQQQLNISEDRYRGLFENAHDGIIILRDEQFVIADINREVEHLIGYEKAELLNKSFIDLFGHMEEAQRFLEEVHEKGEAATDTLPLFKKDGTPLEVDLTIKRINLGNESFYQVIFRDLTEKRILEKKIRQSKRHLQAIFDGIQVRLSIQAPDYQILRVNRGVIEMYRTTYQELIGKKCYEAYYQRSLPCEKCPAAVTIETKQPASSILKIPESDTTLEVFSYPILDEKGNVLSVIEYVRDITEEQRLLEQLIQSEKLAGVGILASGITHEINNPLSGIIGMAEVAMEEEDISAIRNYLKDILISGERIAEIVGGLRSYSRIAKNGELGSIDLNGVLEDSLKMVRLATMTYSVEVIKKLQPLEKVEANAGEIQQVFTNLITNAFQAINTKDGNTGVLTLSTCCLKDSVEVRVSDNGTGIPQKYLTKIFDPFFTTKKVGEGTGLGLNIVYRIVTKYRGTIEVESKEGLGATFTLKFPIRRDE